MQVKSKSGRSFDLPTAAQVVVIRASIAQDANTREVAASEIETMCKAARPTIPVKASAYQGLLKGLASTDVTNDAERF